ncbi:biotin transporter BioY [candidate division WOR-3 bacterium]|uniref:Biotin transporter n=1 Tax=candidate division WOR-3 bacterium TaxID=2052148 RepID=A0A660SJ56_UNCW3|nr:MAG: biotin transporter BioY [candidate division WOR-3 bacterium]
MIRTIAIGRLRPIELLFIPLLSLLTVVGAQLRIPLPFTPVPITLQVFFVLLAGGFRFGYLSQLLYLALGSSGLPFFAFGGGLGYLLGPTGGYLLSFPTSAFISRRFINQDIPIYLALSIGLIVIHLFGTAWLAFTLSLPYLKALLLGSLPFLPYDLIKLLAAGAIIRRLR